MVQRYKINNLLLLVILSVRLGILMCLMVGSNGLGGLVLLSARRKTFLHERADMLT